MNLPEKLVTNANPSNPSSAAPPQWVFVARFDQPRLAVEILCTLILGCALVIGSASAAPVSRGGAIRKVTQQRRLDNGGVFTRFTYTEYHMGVDARIVVYARSRSIAEEACSAAFEKMAQLDSMMSDYRKDSELMHLSAKAGGPPVGVSLDLWVVLRKAQQVSSESNGEFDITVGPLVQLWRRARKSRKLPDPAAIERAKLAVGWQKLRVFQHRRAVQLDALGMMLDLGGIAKGYADDEAQKVLKKHGIRRALVEMGGDIVVTNAPPGTDGWTILVPNEHGSFPLHVSNCAVSTSGDTEQFVVIGGVRYSHVVDPHTGMALTNRVMATVIARDGLTSDPLSTALTLLDQEGRKQLMGLYPDATDYVRVITTN